MPRTSSRKIFLVAVALIIAGWISAAAMVSLQPRPDAGPINAPAEPWHTYRSDAHGITLTYPPDWVAAQGPLPPDVVAAFEAPGTEALVRDGRVDPAYRYELSLRVWPEIADHPLAKKYVPDVATIEEFLRRVPTVSSQGETTVGGLKAYDYLANDGHQFYGLLIPRDGKIYALHFERSWTKARFEEREVLRRVLATVQFSSGQR